ncbi:hypothetical protein [Citrobacter freundii]|uniref:hypothetical protein n=1 Tax=Citrobacter freundii TaxID=546 RepID=UPI0018C815ED|nr:hypothetical protein [Citrobacter freundii]
MTSKQALVLTMNELAEVNAEHVTTISKLEQNLTDMAVQLANAESKCRELAAEVELPDVEKWRSVDAVRAQNAYKVLVSKVLAAAGIGVKG